MAEWSNEKVLKYLELYEAERILWDPMNKNHKIKHKIHAAWKRISENLGNIPIGELKSKKKSLMATFRPLLKKKMASMESGADAEDVLQPVWFAFEAMERFLGTVYGMEDAMNTEVEPQQIDEIASLTQDSSETNEENEQETTNTERQTENGFVPKKRRIDPAFEVEAAQKRLTESFKTLNDIMLTKQDDLENECVLYTKLLATKLRRYPVKQRQRIMYQIDGLLLDNPPESCTSIASFLPSSQNYPVYPNPPSPTYSNSRHCQPSPDYSHDSKPSRHQ
ncbi:uncharacterized protein LOC123311270 isoform X2 [Coccinella septempunctata]|uniref:uncharacterized protein LOC123311270 isoform X2 n=1 Tax=Coccinella septempunctata TaxID=41139 RepID=UPI001D0833D2|nr:uncharacterized protein LOC123311270 isoform X2 [Coccinella septempunctata]